MNVTIQFNSHQDLDAFSNRVEHWEQRSRLVRLKAVDHVELTFSGFCETEQNVKTTFRLALRTTKKFYFSVNP